MKTNPYLRLAKQKKTKAAFFVALVLAIVAFLKGSGYYTLPIFLVTFVGLTSFGLFYRKLTDKKKWLARHASFIRTTGAFDLLLLGDSLTAKWHREIWEKEFSTYRTANFGINGDSSQDILWRIENGELQNIDPTVVVLLCGANNIGRGETPEQIAVSISQITTAILQKRSKTKILLLGIFPIEQQATSWKRGKIKAVNHLISSLHNGENIVYLDIGESFLDQQGAIDKGIMPDYLHLSKHGYVLFANAIREQIHSMLRESGEKAVQPI